MEHKEKEKERELTAELEQSASKLDGTEAGTPCFTYFIGLVERQQAKERFRQRIQLALFTVVAILLMSALIWMAGRFNIVLLLLMQGAVLTGTAVGLLVRLARNRLTGGGVRA